MIEECEDGGKMLLYCEGVEENDEHIDDSSGGDLSEESEHDKDADDGDDDEGLINAIASLAPLAEHRNCARHIYQHWKVKHRGLFMKTCFYRACKSTNEVEFNFAMKEMREGRDGMAGSLAAANDFLNVGPEHFCKAFFRTNSKCGTNTNNMCETFNSYIVAARILPLIEMLERIRRLLMVRHVEKNKVSFRSHDCLCSNVRKELEALKEEAGKYIVRPSLAEKFEVCMANFEKERFIVDFPGKTCSCRFWDLYSMPCSHAIACIQYMKRPVEEYVDPCFKLEAFRKSYGQVLEPLEGPKFWPRGEHPDILPPPYKKLPGRPKKQNRKVSKEEDPKCSTKISRKRLGMKCTVCGNYGHNKRTCRGDISSSQPSEIGRSSQQAEDLTSSQPLGSGKVMRMTCRLCGKMGHNKRTCSRRNEGVTSTAPN
ncbi:hypothetical protein MLD38_024741 [Melastoma candidum]|uniref:Uncharacterized protein n=1 Tax=Melastoma candidum TaxID=119954 RepID=A0ACB9NUT5_9MYRT|nr:hypothetical protein MLD38_024741 [Melastoma candidum]